MNPLRCARLFGRARGLASSPWHRASRHSLCDHDHCRGGRQYVALSALYGGTYFLRTRCHSTASGRRRLPAPETFEPLIDGKTRRCSRSRSAIHRATSPIFRIAEIAPSWRPLIIDNGAHALCTNPSSGADIVVHSLTKYLGGHGTSIGGAIVDSGKFRGPSQKRFRRRMSGSELSRSRLHGSLGPPTSAERVVPCATPAAHFTVQFVSDPAGHRDCLRMERIGGSSQVARHLKNARWLDQLSGLEDHADHAGEVSVRQGWDS